MTRLWEDDEDETPNAGGVFELETMSIHVMADRCATCVFRPGNLMHLSPGRLAQMVTDSVAAQSHITCHDTLLYAQPTRLRPAICKGFRDHPDGNERSLALRTGRSLGTIHYQHVPKEPSMLLAELVATTGLAMRFKRGDVQRDTTGWTNREWKVTYLLDGRTMQTTHRFGNVDQEPDLLETLTHTLDVARLVRSVDSYQEWGREQGGANPKEWPPRTTYAQQVRHTQRLAEFLGDLGRWLEAYGSNTSEAQDQHPVSLDALVPGYDIERPDLHGVRWMVPDCTHDSHGGELCTWRVLAVHHRRAVVAGYVVETENGYQALVWDKDAREVKHAKRPFRATAIADVLRAYDPSQHAAKAVTA